MLQCDLSQLCSTHWPACRLACPGQTHSQQMQAYAACAALSGRHCGVQGHPCPCLTGKAKCKGGGATCLARKWRTADTRASPSPDLCPQAATCWSPACCATCRAQRQSLAADTCLAEDLGLSSTFVRCWGPASASALLQHTAFTNAVISLSCIMLHPTHQFLLWPPELNKCSSSHRTAVYSRMGSPCSSTVVLPDQHPAASKPVSVGVRAIGSCTHCTRSTLEAWPQTILQSH